MTKHVSDETLSDLFQELGEKEEVDQLTRKKLTRERMIDPADLAKALGAEPVGERSEKPLDILDVRHELQNMARKGKDPT
jgi:hypothetical protein